MSNNDPTRPPRPPSKLWKTEICDLLEWYELNLCKAELCDPRGVAVRFSTDRFPHMIKLLNKASGKEVQQPQDEVRAIREETKRNSDYGGYDHERSETLSWIPTLIREPTMILEVIEKTIFEKPGDTLIVKEFEKRGYRQKVLVCRTVGKNLLVPITCHPRNHKKKFSKAYKVVWPA